MMSTNKQGPQYPAKEGAIISGDPAQDVASQGVLGGLATCDRPQRLSPGSLGRSATGETTAEMSSTATVLDSRAARKEGSLTSVPVGSNTTAAKLELRAATEKGPSKSVPAGPTAKPRKARKRGSEARLLKGARPLSSIASWRIPAKKLEVPEAGTSGVTGRPTSSDSEATMTDTVSHVASEEEDMLLASSNEETAAGADPGTLDPVEEETSGSVGTSTGKKRKTEDGPTPPRKKGKKKKNRGGPPLGKSFDQAEKDNLLGVVLVRDHPHTVLSKAQLNHLREKLMEQLDATIASRSESIPQFEESGTRHGRLHISCADPRSHEWLKTTIENTTVPPEEEGKEEFSLQLATLAEVPKLLRAEVYLTGKPPGIPTFCMRLRAQNSGLHTDRWLLRHQQATDHGLLMVWSIDKESADVLESVDDRPYYGFGRVTFRVSRGPDPKGSSQQ